MKISSMTVAVLAVSTIAGFAPAQVGGPVRVSGFEHDPLGAAIFSAPSGRRLPVHNIGSSGQDGVEIKLRTSWGGGAGIDVGHMFNTQGAMLRTKYKGWDGTIKSIFTVASNGNGTGTMTADFTALGATSLHVTEFGTDGTVVFDGTTTGGIANYPCVPTCPDGSPGIVWYLKRWDSNQQKYIYMWVWTCEEGKNLRGEDYPGMRVITPNLPAGSPDTDAHGIESMIVTGRNLEHMDVLEANTTTFDLQTWGTNSASVGEVCDSGATDCDRFLRGITAGCGTNLDSVTVDLGNDATSGTFSAKRGEAELNLNAIDKKGRSIGRFTTSSSPLTPMQSLAADFSSLGASQVLVQFYNESGEPIASAFLLGTTAAIAWDPHCPAGSYATGHWIPNGGGWKWHFDGCVTYSDFVLPGGGVIVAKSVSFEAVNPTVHTTAPSQLAFTGNASEIISLSGIAVNRNHCSADFNADGAADFFDYLDFVDAFSAGGVVADFNDDGSIDFFDYLDFVDAFSAGC